MLITDKNELKKYSSSYRLWQGIPGIEVTKKGRIFLASYGGGIMEQIGNYAFLLKSDDGVNFGEPIAVVYAEAHRCYDPCLWIDPLDRLWFIWAYAPEHAVYAVICDEPDANELVWSEKIRIGSDVMMNKPTVLSSGEWLFPVAVWNDGIRAIEAKYDTKNADKGSFVYRSCDNGKSFHKLGGADVKRRTFDEHMLLELNDGTLAMYVRTTYGIGVSYSQDKGATWSEGVDSGLGGPNTRFFIRRLKSGRILLINHDNYKGRNNLTALLSEDDGKTWRYKLLLDERDNVSYPDAIEAEDGYIYITYDRERGAWLQGNPITSYEELYSRAREVLVAKITEQDIIEGKLVNNESRLKLVASKLGKYANEECEKNYGEIIELNENGINTVFEVTADKRVHLLHMSNLKWDGEKNIDAKKWFTPVDVHISGENQYALRGAMHAGSSGSESLRYVNHKYYQNETGNKFELELADDKMNVTLHYQFYNGISAVRTWADVRNTCDYKLGIEYVSSFSLTGVATSDKARIKIPNNAWSTEVNWKDYSIADFGFELYKKDNSTKRISFSNSGTWSTKEYLPMGALYEPDKACMVMWQIENNGSWQWEIGDMENNLFLKLSGPTENENCWHKELLPNEVFSSVKTAIVFGKDINEVVAAMTLYRRKIAKRLDKDMAVIFNDYMNCLWGEPTTEKLIPIIDKAAMTGAEYFCVDAGWYADGTWWETVGEWMPCDWRFPNGIKEVFDYIKSKDMIPGIWLEIEVMGINCPILNQFTDDCFFMRNGRRVIDNGRYQLDFRNNKVRSFATAVIDRLVSEYGVGYIKMDYNIDGGKGTEVDADSLGDGLLGHGRSVKRWAEEIAQKYPDVIFENCSSGGMRMDYAMLSTRQLQSVTDQPDGKRMLPIAAAAATAVLPEQAAIWSYPVASDDMDTVFTNMVNSIPLRMHLSGEITKLNKEQFEAVAAGVKCHKKIRNEIAQSLPFYPLGIETYGKEWICAGYKTTSGAYLAVWHTEGNMDNVIIPINFEFEKAECIYPYKEYAEILKENKKIKVFMDKNYSGIIIKLA